MTAIRSKMINEGAPAAVSTSGDKEDAIRDGNDEGDDDN